ncbi:MAG: IS4 family transposase [Eubacterium sp.]|nr:IS4 family transposase [Eubacterium sp.]
MDRKLLCQSMLISVKKCLESEDFLNEFREPNRFVRRRILSMKDVINFLIFHPKKTLDTSWEAFRKKYKPQKMLPIISKQALSKARAGIKPELFRELFDLTVTKYYAHTRGRKKWMERYHLFAIDGSDFEVPSSKGNFEEFGKNSDKKRPGLLWSMAKSSVLYDISGDIIVDAIIDKQRSHERDLAMRHLARLSDLGIQSDGVVIFDRGYYSADMFAECHNTGSKSLMRLRKCMKFCQLPGDDVFSNVIAPDGTKIPCRILKATLPTGETEYLITDIMDEDITCDMFRDLYFERWKVESKYLELSKK